MDLSLYQVLALGVLCFGFVWFSFIYSNKGIRPKIVGLTLLIIFAIVLASFLKGQIEP